MRLILVLLISMFVVSPVLAQGNPNGLTDAEIEAEIEPVIKDVEGLRLKVVEQTQNPETKDIIFDVVVYSQIRSDRVQLRWSVSGVAELVTPIDKISFSVDPGTIKTTQIVVRPRARGVTVLSLEVEAFEIEGSYLATGLKRIYSLSDGRRLPIREQYQQLELIIGVKGIANTLLILFGGVLVIRIGYGIFQKWLNRTEEVEGII